MKASLLLAAAALSIGAGASFLTPETAAAPATAASAPASYMIDSGHSFVMFRTQHLNVGYAYGTFNKVAGSVEYDPADPGACSIEVTIDAASVDTNSQGRDDHLRGPDFLSAKEFPELTFKSTQVTKKGEGLEVVGDLSLHGVTRSVTVDVPHVAMVEKDPWGNQRAGFEGTFEINAKDFEIRYMADKDMLGPTIQVHVAPGGHPEALAVPGFRLGHQNRSWGRCCRPSSWRSCSWRRDCGAGTPRVRPPASWVPWPSASASRPGCST